MCSIKIDVGVGIAAQILRGATRDTSFPFLVPSGCDGSE